MSDNAEDTPRRYVHLSRYEPPEVDQQLADRVRSILTGADPKAFQVTAGKALIRYYEGIGWYDLPDPHGAGAAVVEALLSDEKLINYVRRSLTEGEEPDGAG